ncbi:MAG: SUMF1/EgtB/PvdO family nonheme iron enzyme [Deltaproteobacteria bacterium]|uniref:SUMF1/EgtB/PvdO family nonheme iron enzyme n=1 Tax=Candidatus Zymogenus saltonus TaxID=2844893 RepID=A0A9D8KIB4_9DELT|nr:SUMF1/EgtB/PvdO family nonheme iron enzyme [Candidatus Zymogenus saltonus]
MERYIKIFGLIFLPLLLFSYSFAFQDTAAPAPDAESMALIPGGSYTMSCGDPDKEKIVELDPFYIDTFEVTNEKFARFLNAVYPEVKEGWLLWVNTDKGSEFKITKNSAEGSGEGVFSVVEGYENHPVVTVSWEGAMAYAKWEGKSLPTMKQWEAAARGNSTARFPWGDEIDPEKANYRTNEKLHTKEKGEIRSVGSYPPNEFGLYDVVGNAWEWTIDESKTGFLSFVPFINSLSFLTNPLKTLMGGSYLTGEDEIGVSLAHPANLKARFGNVGFRCVTAAE